jgi:hypothetical protein
MDRPSDRMPRDAATRARLLTLGILDYTYDAAGRLQQVEFSHGGVVVQAIVAHLPGEPHPTGSWRFIPAITGTGGSWEPQPDDTVVTARDRILRALERPLT